MKKYILATFHAYKSQAEFQANKDNWIGASVYNLKSENFKSLKNELESKAIEFKNNLKSDGTKFAQVYVYIDDDYVVNMIADISYDFSEK